MITVGALPLRAGMQGEAVADLQHRLVALGHDLGDDAIGSLGAGTQAAVADFQTARGLRVDGICGDETWDCLVDTGRSLGERLLYERAPMLRGDDVADLQTVLGELGFDPGRPDGFFGPHTARALTEFQRNSGLPTDGVCGPDTLAALARVSGRAEGGSTVARVRETDSLRRGALGLVGRRIALGDAGEAAVLTEELGLVLREQGAEVAVLHHPDESERAAEANGFAAAAVLTVSVRAEASGGVAFYARDDYESVSGRYLAELACAALGDDAGWGEVGAKGMRLRILRETRMPAIVVELGPPARVVEQAPRIVAALATAVTRWASEPVE